ncbi:hypothetical protein JDV02_010324 [Purpureocillium takamizusanense]|uniref:Uncharacterized protein n=1 Tax=Purpureocillium takamizusanense TaxID=2060973 RepID=A0A9Q8VF36_9HYPO|nr:uncharacterized protein JDV02_010324 [Purpureocillium takamizusanense]UNI24590.1 hypothetical protein JDV02_010324 [Purpureocillium takamizusanense]
MRPDVLLQSLGLASSARTTALWTRDGHGNGTDAANMTMKTATGTAAGRLQGGVNSSTNASMITMGNATATSVNANTNTNSTAKKRSSLVHGGEGGSSSIDRELSTVGYTTPGGGYTVVPRDLPDGHYTMTLHPNGTVLRTRRSSARRRYGHRLLDSNSGSIVDTDASSNNTRPSPPHQQQEKKEQQKTHTLYRRAGTGEYTFLVDDANLRLEAVSLDTHPVQRLPLPPGVQCHCAHQRDYSTLSYPLPPDDYYASKQELFNWCNAFKWQGHHVGMALGGSVGVYACGRKVTHHTEDFCSEAEFLAAERILNATCGDAAGYVYIPDWNKEYGRMLRGERMCRLWQDGPQQHINAKAVFDDVPGRGALTSEPEGDRPKVSADDLYYKTVFEPLNSKFGNEGEDERQDYRAHYHQYAPGWKEGWKVLKPPHEEQWEEEEDEKKKEEDEK